MNRFLVLFILFAFISPSLAAEKDMFRSTTYPLPRFVTISSNKAYVRTGPDKKYPVKWVYQQKGLPVEIILEFDHWRKIRDIAGDEGWVHHSLLSGRRGAIITPQEGAEGDLVMLLRKPKEGARATAKLAGGVIASIKECRINYCNINANGFRGWVDRDSLWGIYSKEIIEE